MIRKEPKNHRGKIRSDCGGYAAWSSMIFSPGPQGIRLAAVGFSMASETESSCTPIWSKRLVINGGARRPPSECYPASPLAEAFSRTTATAARTFSVQEGPGACTVSAEIPARRSKSGSGARRTYRTPCLRRSIENSTLLNKRRSGTIGSGDLWVLSIPGKYRAAGMTSRRIDRDYHGRTAER